MSDTSADGDALEGMNRDAPARPAVPPMIAECERIVLAPYAVHSVDSLGRKHAEPGHRYRGPFQRDRDRIIHSAAFRRLSHKTQVFTGEMGDYHRTRLTHTLEVASMARTLGRALRLNEDLIEALALAHDLGHPPFGHTGEAVLNRCLSAVGGFNHNRHGLRIVVELERRWTAFPGLNLSREVLLGQEARAERAPRRPAPLLEAQVVDAADSVTYDTHDADDAMKVGLLTLPELLELPLWQEAALRVREGHASLGDDELRRAVLHELIDWQVGDLFETASTRLAEIDSVEAVRQAGLVIRPNPELSAQKEELERFLHLRVYRHPLVQRMRTKAEEMLQHLFAHFVAHPESMPASFFQRTPSIGVERSVCDYLAGMTDRFAQEQFQKI